MILLVLWILLAFIPAFVAKGKGNSFLLFFLLSIVLSPIIGLIIALIVSPKSLTKDGVQIPAGSVADELVKLKSLLDSGALTHEEFQRKKTQLLG